MLKIKVLGKNILHSRINSNFFYSVEENMSNPNVDENEMVIAEPLPLPLPKELEHLKAREHEDNSENFNTDVSTLQVSPYLKFFNVNF